MRDHGEVIRDLINRRVSLIGKMSDFNANGLRLLQQKLGNDVLLINEPYSAEYHRGINLNNRQIVSNLACIAQLEIAMQRLDHDIESALSKEK